MFLLLNFSGNSPEPSSIRDTECSKAITFRLPTRFLTIDYEVLQHRTPEHEHVRQIQRKLLFSSRSMPFYVRQSTLVLLFLSCPLLNNEVAGRFRNGHLSANDAYRMADCAMLSPHDFNPGKMLESFLSYQSPAFIWPHLFGFSSQQQLGNGSMTALESGLQK